METVVRILHAITESSEPYGLIDYLPWLCWYLIADARFCAVVTLVASTHLYAPADPPVLLYLVGVAIGQRLPRVCADLGIDSIDTARTLATWDPCRFARLYLTQPR